MKATSITGMTGQSVRATRRALSALSLAALGVAAVGVQAAPVNVTLCAQAFTQQVSPTVSVPMWGYSLGACGAAAPSAPGPLLTLAPGEGPLVVTLINNLPVPTSLVLAGQALPTGSAPVFATDVQDATGSTICTPSQADTACRVRSFVTETTPAGGAQTYTFNNLRAGTYLYQSGTHPQVQVQMGLFGMAKQDAAAGQLFIGRPYAVDVPVVLSEIDPDMHQRIADTLGTSGNQAAWKANNNSTLAYTPKYFLINGKVFDGTSANDLPVTTTNGAAVILRLANAGLQSRSLMLNGGHWTVLTEDGYPYPTPREQYTLLLPAGKTGDAQIAASVPASGANTSLAIFDRRGGTHNADGGVLGGQVARLAMSAPVGPQLQPVPNQVVNEGTNWSYALAGSNATSYALTGAPVDAGWAFNTSNGLMSWSPVPLGTAAGTSYAMSASATDGASTSPAQSFTLRINHTPTLTAPAATAVAQQTVVVPLLATAVDIDDDTLTPALTLLPAGGTTVLNANGTLSYTRPASTATASNPVAAYTYSYRVADPYGLMSAVVTGTLNVAANQQPVANSLGAYNAPGYAIQLAGNAAQRLDLNYQLNTAIPSPLVIPFASLVTGTDSDGQIVPSTFVASNVTKVNITTGNVIGLLAGSEATAVVSADGSTITFRPRNLLGALVGANSTFTTANQNSNLTTIGVYRITYTVKDNEGRQSAPKTIFLSVRGA